MYQASSASFSSGVSAVAPLTCAQPVMPGRTRSRVLRVGRLVDRQQRTRPDQRHFATDDVPQLRNLVESGLADQRANFRQSFFQRNGPPVTAERRLKRAEFVEQKFSPILANSLLPKYDRRAHVERDDRRDHKRDRRQHDEKRKRGDRLYGPPEPKVERGWRDRRPRDRVVSNVNCGLGRNEVQRSRHRGATQASTEARIGQCAQDLGLCAINTSETQTSSMQTPCSAYSLRSGIGPPARRRSRTPLTVRPMSRSLGSSAATISTTCDD